MTTDIVERLRAYGGNELCHQEAADEIEMLRMKLDEAQRAWHASEAEIERLRVDRDNCKAGMIANCEEIERLRNKP